jgi:hypothetical protein
MSNAGEKAKNHNGRQLLQPGVNHSSHLAGDIPQVLEVAILQVLEVVYHLDQGEAY